MGIFSGLESLGEGASEFASLLVKVEAFINSPTGQKILTDAKALVADVEAAVPAVEAVAEVVK